MLILYDDVSLEQLALLASKFFLSSGFSNDLASNQKGNLPVRHICPVLLLM